MPCTILHIDDNAADLELTKMALAELDHDVAYTGQTDPSLGLESLASARSLLPRLIIVDLNMPKMNGIQFITAVKRDRRLRECPVVVLTSSVDAREVSQCQDLGALAVLTKPNTYAELLLLARKLTELC